MKVLTKRLIATLAVFTLTLTPALPLSTSLAWADDPQQLLQQQQQQQQTQQVTQPTQQVTVTTTGTSTSFLFGSPLSSPIAIPSSIPAPVPHASIVQAQIAQIKNVPLTQVKVYSVKVGVANGVVYSIQDPATQKTFFYRTAVIQMANGNLNVAPNAIRELPRTESFEALISDQLRTPLTDVQITSSNSIGNNTYRLRGTAGGRAFTAEGTGVYDSQRREYVYRVQFTDGTRPLPPLPTMPPSAITQQTPGFWRSSTTAQVTIQARITNLLNNGQRRIR